MHRNTPFCDGLARRDFLRVGTAGLFGLSLPALLERQARAAEKGQSPKDVSLIFLFLHGGLSTIDTWDLKPDAPVEFRGEFKPAATKVPGIRIGELVPRIGRQMDKFSLIRSFRHHNSDHGPADHYIYTGYFPGAGFNPNLNPNNQRPAHGSIIAKKLGPRGSVPAYVCLPKMHPSAGPAYLGAGAAPFVIDADPNAPNFAVPDLVPPVTLSADRLQSRKNLLAAVDRFQKSAEVRANAAAGAVGTFQEKAFSLMTSPEAKKAFDIKAEPEKMRDEYGRHSLGQSCLMARRLIEAGVRCVTIDHSNWDTHDNNFKTLKRDLLPGLDAALSTLFRDLADRGLLERTLVLVTGEFGAHAANQQERRPRPLGPGLHRRARRRRHPGGSRRWQERRPCRKAGQRSVRPGRPVRHDVPPARHRSGGRVLHAGRPAGEDRQQRAGDSGVAVTV